MYHEPKILIIYTGGTIGMIFHPENGSLTPFDFSQIKNEVPELQRFGFTLDTIAFTPPVDSANVTPETWIRIARLVFEHYNNYDGFVILHGTDTMAYTASALSFIFENLTKPVILTGAQLPIGSLRTDGKENLVSAIEIAASHTNYGPVVPEVCIYFENKLYRGNRAKKNKAQNFNAFQSPNYPPLAETGVNIVFNHRFIQYPEVACQNFLINEVINPNVSILKVFPGIQPQVVEAITNIPGNRAIVLETYGAGNATNQKWFLDLIKNAINRNIIVVNVTQCDAGYVDMGKYETSIELQNSGVLSGYNTTSEAAITKLMVLLGKCSRVEEVAHYMAKSLRGEISIP